MHVSCSIPVHCIIIISGQKTFPKYNRDERRGPYYSTLLVTLVKECFFESKDSMGFKFNSYFNPIKLETIAFFATAVSVIVSNSHSCRTSLLICFSVTIRFTSQLNNGNQDSREIQKKPSQSKETRTPTRCTSIS